MSAVGLRTGAGSFDERVSPRVARRCFGVFAVLLVALALMAAPARADFAAGVAAYDAGNYVKAYAEFLPLARGGDAAAQYSLGNMYRRGQGVARDDAEAVRWYRKAADQGNASAQYLLGVMYDGGRGVTEDHSEAVRWYRSAADQGHAFAQDQIYRLEGRSPTKTPATACE